MVKDRRAKKAMKYKGSLILMFIFVLGRLAGAEKIDPQVAAQAQAAVNLALPGELPSLTGGGIVVEKEPNGIGRKVWVVIKAPGIYVLQGTACEGRELPLGTIYYEAPRQQQDPVGLAVIFDSVAVVTAVPYFPQVCSIDVFRVEQGRVERSTVEINPWGSRTSPELHVGSEGLTQDGRYFLSVEILPPDATVIIGRSMVAAEIQRSPAGSIVVFPKDTTMPPPGPTTLTLCTKGKCGTTTFERKLVAPPPQGGKG